MLKKLTKKKDEGVDERKAKIIFPKEVWCIINCNYICDPYAPPDESAEPTAEVCLLIK